jgi:hypothetical protein
VPYDTAGYEYTQTPLTHCKICGKRLTLTNEFDTCIECQQENMNELEEE